MDQNHQIMEEIITPEVLITKDRKEMDQDHQIMEGIITLEVLTIKDRKEIESSSNNQGSQGNGSDSSNNEENQGSVEENPPKDQEVNQEVQQ